MSIIVNGVSKFYGAQQALNNVSLEVKNKEIVGFLGPNGAGKSTLMKIITTYIPPTSGSVSVCGIDILEDSLEVRKLIGYLPEHNPLYLDMYVKEFLTFTCNLYKLKNASQRLKDVIHMTGLTLEQNKKIGALSKGYRQRVGIAQAIIHDPKVLILDEPTSGLDPNQLEEIRKLILTLGSEKTVMLSTHIMQEVEAVCDRVMIINKGHIVANDQTKQLQSRNQKIKIQFNSQAPLNLIEKLPSVVAIKTIENNIYMVTAATNNNLQKELFDFAIQHNLTILTLQKVEESIEELFKSITKPI